MTIPLTPIGTKKETCLACNKFISIHNRIMTCSLCKSIYHSECSKKHFYFNHGTGQWNCIECQNNEAMRYNPFSLLCGDKYTNSNIEEIEDIQTISKVLSSCKLFDKSSLPTTFGSSISADDFSLVFNNIDGNSTNFDSFITDLSQYKAKFSAIAIAETNIAEEHQQLYKITGYRSEYGSKKTGKNKGSGLGIYLREDYQFNKIEKFCQCTDNLESLFIEITSTRAPQIIGVIYRPPSGSKLGFYHEFEALLKELPTENTYVVGDFNIDLLSASSDFEQVIYAKNMIPTISIATHEMPGCRPTLIDNILTNSTENLILSGVMESKVSHHNPIICQFECPAKESSDEDNSMSPKYDFSNVNMGKFTESLLTKLGNAEPNFSYDSQQSFDDFVSIINISIEENFLLDKGSLKKSKRNKFYNPWVTNGIIASIQQKTLFYRQWKKTCSKHNVSGDKIKYERYKLYRLRLKKLIKLSKKNYYSRKFEKVKGNSKKTWELINELRGKSKSNIKASFMIDGKLVADKREIANEFNTFFSSIAKKVNAKVYSSTLNSPVSSTCDRFRKHLDKNMSPMGSMFMSPCSRDEVAKIIRDLENGKASDISIPLLKNFAPLILDYLILFFNQFIDKGIFPRVLKRGSITPIYKKGDSRFLDNYRPVSTIPIFGKILEKIMYSRLYSYLISKQIISENQFGFRSQHSTGHAVNYSVNHILQQLGLQKHVIGIFIDLSKAFDTISHSKLLYKLQFYGVRGKSIDMIKSYLSFRTQKTKFQGTFSEDSEIEYGVPQGSVLGPLLFITYINDIVNASRESQFVMFADDTNIFVSADTENEVYEAANNVLQNVYDFMYDNLLHMNTTKSCYMYFAPNIKKNEGLCCARTRPLGTENTIKLCGNKLKRVNKVRFLGVIIDDNLTWDAHIDYLESLLNSKIILIKRIRRYIPEAEYSKIYEALFVSHLTYCISSWGGIPMYKLSKIFSIQKRCVRLLFGEKPNFDHQEFYETCARARTYQEHISPKNYELEHTKPLFNKKKLLTYENLYRYHVFMDVFKTLKCRSPISIYNTFEMSNRQGSYLLRVPISKSIKNDQNFFVRSCKIWNSMIGKILSTVEPSSSGIVIPGSSENSDLSASVSVVKLRVKQFLLSNQGEGNPERW